MVVLQIISYIVVVFIGGIITYSKFIKIKEKLNLCEESLKERNDKIKELQNEKENLIEYKIKYEVSENNNKMLIEDKEQMALKFKEISNSVLMQQKEYFEQQQKNGLSNILQPLQVEIKNFKEKVIEADKNTIETKTALNSHIEDLIKQTNNIGQQADNLANALKGDKKRQGNWGEMQLKNIFEINGLQENIDYQCQYYIKDLIDNEKKYYLDFVLYLPDNKKIILDSKVSLNNYEKYINASDENEKDAYLKQYVADLKKHITELSDKEYQRVFKEYKKESQSDVLDFVFMFLPLESAYIDALKFDDGLYSFAFKNKVSIVTASSLLPVIKMIQQIWNIERQNKNIESIVEKSVNLYNKICSFVEYFNKIEVSIDNAKKSFCDAKKYLISGRSNAIKTCEDIKHLFGKNKVNKDINPEYLLDNVDED